MWAFNPPEPTCQPVLAGLDNEGLGAGDVRCVPPNFFIDVEFGENDSGFLYYPQAQGQHVLTRQLTLSLAQQPYDFLVEESIDFEYEHLAPALWQAPPADLALPSQTWRLAYDWPFSRIPMLNPPPDNAWVLWFSPAYWVATGAEELNIVFPWYSADDFAGLTNLFDALRLNTLDRDFAGNDAINGVFQLLEFPETLIPEPLW